MQLWNCCDGSILGVLYTFVVLIQLITDEIHCTYFTNANFIKMEFVREHVPS